MRPGVLAQLREMVPIRPLTRAEAMSIAERQAQRFRVLVRATDDYVLDDQLIVDLPRMEVRRLSPWPSSGATQWINGRWVVVLNASEPTLRQRFSLAHELKHIIDHRFIDIIHDHVPAHERHEFTERVCDYFAGCVLMPRPLVKRAFTTGTQDIAAMARKFNVSQPAMATRLRQIGLTEPTPRCARPPKDWATRAIEQSGGNVLYQRTATPLLAISPRQTR